MQRVGNNVILKDDNDHKEEGLKVYKNLLGTKKVFMVEKKFPVVTVQESDIIPGFRWNISSIEFALNWRRHV